MANLNAFGFQVRKTACDDVPWSENSINIPKEQQHLPWHLPLKSTASKNSPLQKNNAQPPSQQQQQQQQQQQGHTIVLKSKRTSSLKNNTITRYFQSAPTVPAAAAAVLSTKEEISEQCNEEDDSHEYCVVKHRIPFSELWSSIVEDLHPSYSMDAPPDDDLLTMRVLSVRSPRGLRRKTRDDEDSDNEEEGGSRRSLGRAKMTKLDLVSAFQNVLTVSPTANNMRMMDFEYDVVEDDDDNNDYECFERPVKNRMSAAEAALLFQYIADELLMY